MSVNQSLERLLVLSIELDIEVVRLSESFPLLPLPFSV